MQHRGSERPDGSGAVQSAALKSGSAQPAAKAKRYSDHQDRIPNPKRSCTDDSFQVAQNAASASGPSRLGEDGPLHLDVWKLLEPLPDTEKAADPRWHDDGVASAIEQDLRAYCDARGEGGTLLHGGLKKLRLQVFGKAKFPVDEELWIPGAAPPGEQQYVETMITEFVVLPHATAHLVELAPGDGPAHLGDSNVDGETDWLLD